MTTLSFPYRALVLATLGQFAAWLCSSLIAAAAIPCCDNPTPPIPAWYAFMATPILVAVYLLPGFLCGLFVSSRPVLVAALAGGLGTYLFHLFGSHLRALILPEWAMGNLGNLQSIWYAFSSFAFNVHAIVPSLFYAAIAAAAASAGVLLRLRRRVYQPINPNAQSAPLRARGEPPFA